MQHNRPPDFGSTEHKKSQAATKNKLVCWIVVRILWPLSTLCVGALAIWFLEWSNPLGYPGGGLPKIMLWAFVTMTTIATAFVILKGSLEFPPLRIARRVALRDQLVALRLDSTAKARFLVEFDNSRLDRLKEVKEVYARAVNFSKVKSS